MTTNGWNWKGKDGSRGGLLYESGNWGDILKLAWVAAVLRWKNTVLGGQANYFDPFAGDVKYPLGRKTLYRYEAANLPALAFIRPQFVDDGFWPSSASAASLLTGGEIEVYDAGAGRRAHWESTPWARVLQAESGWELLESHRPDPGGVWLLDPYDFLADWRQLLPLVTAKARTTSILVYLYNRSARTGEAFSEYRAFKNALEDLRGDAPKCLGRVAADAFLPRAHHEVLLLPCQADAANGGYEGLRRELRGITRQLVAACTDAAAFDE